MINGTGETGILTDNRINTSQTITITNPGKDLREDGNRASALKGKPGTTTDHHNYQDKTATINRGPKEARTKDEQEELTDQAQVTGPENRVETHNKEIVTPP